MLTEIFLGGDAIHDGDFVDGGFVFATIALHGLFTVAISHATTKNNDEKPQSAGER